jgi:hypothetical protein
MSGNFHRNTQINEIPENHPWRQDKDALKDEWIVKVKWLKTFDENEAKWFKGAFANQNVVCKLRDQNTYEFLLNNFEVSTSD